MIGVGENELICDFAETYHIYDYRSLPVSRAAILASGLREDARIRMKMNGHHVPLRERLIAGLYDLIVETAYAIGGSKDAPPSLLEQIDVMDQTAGRGGKSGNGIIGFRTPDELNNKLKELRGEG